MTDQRLAPGDPAPDFTLPDADGHPVALSSFRGQRVIVYFYPAAMTPGCTKEACDFRDSLADLNSAGITVLGISPDQPAKLAKFRDKEGLTFPLLSDPSREVLKAYGAYGEKMMYGKTTVALQVRGSQAGQSRRLPAQPRHAPPRFSYWVMHMLVWF